MNSHRIKPQTLKHNSLKIIKERNILILLYLLYKMIHLSTTEHAQTDLISYPKIFIAQLSIKNANKVSYQSLNLNHI